MAKLVRELARTSSGAAAAATALMASPRCACRAWWSAPWGVGGGSWDFPDPIGRQRMLRYPAGEHITVPRHVRTQRVRTLLTASTVISLPLVPRIAPLVLPPFQLAMRTPLRRALAAAIPRLPEGPSEGSRRRASFMVVCEARQGSKHRSGTVTGKDPYGLTARATVEGGLRLAAPGYDRRGALAPSQAFDPRDLLLMNVRTAGSATSREASITLTDRILERLGILIWIVRLT